MSLACGEKPALVGISMCWRVKRFCVRPGRICCCFLLGRAFQVADQGSKSADGSGLPVFFSMTWAVGVSRTTYQPSLKKQPQSRRGLGMCSNSEAPSAPYGVLLKGKGPVATFIILFPFATPTVTLFVTNVLSST